jgi:hypothetical protein
VSRRSGEGSARDAGGYAGGYPWRGFGDGVCYGRGPSITGLDVFICLKVCSHDVSRAYCLLELAAFSKRSVYIADSRSLLLFKCCMAQRQASRPVSQ